MKKLTTKSMVSLLIILTMILSCFSNAVFASEEANGVTIVSPENGKTYDISNTGIFDITEADGTTATYVLNGTETGKEDLAEAVKLGKNVLEVYAANQYERIAFTTEKTYVYQPDAVAKETFESATKISEAKSIVNWALTNYSETLDSTGGKTGKGVKFTCKAADTTGKTSTNVQLRAGKGSILGLRESSDGNTYDNRFLSGKMVYSVDVKVENLSSFAVTATLWSTTIPGKISNTKIYDEDNSEVTNVEISNGNWFNVKYVCDFNLKTTYFYVENTLCATAAIESYPVVAGNQLIQIRFNDNTNGKSTTTFTIDNVDFHWEIPAEIEAISYGSTRVGDNGVVEAGTTALALRTSLRIKDSDITSDNIAFYKDGEAAEECMLITAVYEGGALTSATPETITAANDAAATMALSVAEGANIMLWTKDGLKPLTTKK